MYSSREFFNKANEVYNSLSDDLSKEIFKKRLIFNVTQNIDDLHSFVETALEGYEYGKVEAIDSTYADYNVYSDETPLVIYGAGIRGQRLFKAYELSERKNVLFCDRNFEKTKECCGVPVISPQDLIKNHKDTNIIITPLYLKDDLSKYFIDNGILKKRIYSYPDYDYENKQYFDPVVTFSNNEIFVDVGVLDGMTSKKFAEKCRNKYKKIFMFEPDPNCSQKTKENVLKWGLNNVEVFEVGLWNEQNILTFYSDELQQLVGSISSEGNVKVKVDKLDNLLIDEPTTFIKMDIEGAELNALIGSHNTIKKYKPKLAVSVYHKSEDLLDIILYLKSLVPVYKFYLRHYSFRSVETILYAIPPYVD